MEKRDEPKTNQGRCLALTLHVSPDLFWDLSAIGSEPKHIQKPSKSMDFQGFFIRFFVLTDGFMDIEAFFSAGNKKYHTPERRNQLK